MKISVRFELDAAGRPTKKLTLPLPQPANVAGFTATHNADNQITGVPYDADGNLQSSYLPLSWFPVAEMAWDTRNRLSQIWEEVWDGEAFVGYYQSQFVYDAEGHRTHQTNGGQTTRYTVNPHGLSGLSEVLIEHKPNSTQRRYLWGGPAGLLYEIQTDSSGAETSVRYYHSDQAGSTLALTDSAGEVTGRAEYTPYGVISHTSGVMDTPYLFNGAYGVQTDFQTGLIHMRARYYHPWLGRFISEDPIQFDGGNNWYAFANGDPVMKMDPSGLEVFAAARDLNGVPLGTHQFIIMVPDPSTNVIPYRLQDLGNGTQGIVVGAHNTGRLQVKFFEQADYQATKEYYNPSAYTSWYRSDFDTEVRSVARPSGISQGQFEHNLLTSISNYQYNEATSNIPYPTGCYFGGIGVNSNSWVQSTLSYAGGTVNGNFSGADLLHAKKYHNGIFRIHQ